MPKINSRDKRNVAKVKNDSMREILMDIEEKARFFSTKLPIFVTQFKNERKINAILKLENDVMKGIVEKLQAANNNSLVGKTGLDGKKNSSFNEKVEEIKRIQKEFKQCRAELLTLKAREIETQKKTELNETALKNLLTENSALKTKENELNYQISTQFYTIQNGNEQYNRVIQSNSVTKQRIYEQNLEIEYLKNEQIRLSEENSKKEEFLERRHEEISLLRDREIVYIKEISFKNEEIDNLKRRICDLNESETNFLGKNITNGVNPSFD